MPLRKPCIVCGRPGTTTGRCPAHQAKAGTTARGYGTDHQRERRRQLAAAIGQPCCLCGEPMLAGQALALDHTPDRTAYRGMAHATCNSRDGARRRRF